MSIFEIFTYQNTPTFVASEALMKEIKENADKDPSKTPNDKTEDTEESQS